MTRSYDPSLALLARWSQWLPRTATEAQRKEVEDRWKRACEPPMYAYYPEWPADKPS